MYFHPSHSWKDDRNPRQHEAFRSRCRRRTEYAFFLACVTSYADQATAALASAQQSGGGASAGGAGGAGGAAAEAAEAAELKALAPLLKHLNHVTIAHGTIMCLAFVIFFPAGSFIIRLGHFKGVVYVHVGIQMFAYIMSMAGMGLGVYLANAPKKFGRPTQVSTTRGSRSTRGVDPG